MQLGVNIDHIATLRNARLPEGVDSSSQTFPDPVRAALVCQRAGAHSVVMHLREDRRHVRDQDLFCVKKAIRIRLNLEMSIAPEIVKIAMRLKPHQATLVPERRKEMTTEGGLHLGDHQKRIANATRRLAGRGIEVSLFIDPDLHQVVIAKRIGAEAVEFHTGDYANAITRAAKKKQLRRIEKAVLLANMLGLKAHAGHGLDYHNVPGIKKIHGIQELNIGYAIITRSIWVGLDEAVREMLRCMR